MTLNRQDIIDQLVEKHKYTRIAATSVVDDFTDIIIDNMADGNTVTIYGFGSFSVLEKKPSMCTNPRTGEPCFVPAKCVPRFRPGKRMRAAAELWNDNRARRWANGNTAKA